MFLDPTPVGHFRRRTSLSKDTHAAIKLEYAYRTRVEQGLIMAIVLFAMVLIGFAVLDIAVRILAEISSARPMFMLGFLCVFLFPIPAGLAIELWTQRRNSAIKIECILAQNRCPSCAHDLTGAKPDPADHCTLCPECGAAWKLSPPQHP